jgi:hypothetical protein
MVIKFQLPAPGGVYYSASRTLDFFLLCARLIQYRPLCLISFSYVFRSLGLLIASVQDGGQHVTKHFVSLLQTWQSSFLLLGPVSHFFLRVFCQNIPCISNLTHTRYRYKNFVMLDSDRVTIRRTECKIYKLFRVISTCTKLSLSTSVTKPYAMQNTSDCTYSSV